MGVVHVSA